ncbi:hypothetical protein KAI04_02520 [Candidatus Pacearchaeota archaeon]|nr:hypothetical protein [Candidatus Pacearchaeota archaeon]
MVKNPKKYLSRKKIYYDSGEGAISGELTQEKETYYFNSEDNEKIPLTFSGKNRVIVKDGMLVPKLFIQKQRI